MTGLFDAAAGVGAGVLGILVRTITAVVETMTDAVIVGTASPLLGAIALALVVSAALVLIAVVCSRRATGAGHPESRPNRPAAATPVLLTQSNPNAAGRVRSRAPNGFAAS